jgi:hypothetical protein
MKPHGIKDGIKRIPLHVGTFGVGSAVALILLPPGPIKWFPLVACVAQAIRGEIDDVQNGEDTIVKALIDAVSQCAGALIGALLR